jgi:hypothetical protein
VSVTIIRQRDGLAFTWDKALTELYEPATTVTVHPVESGVDITDHAQPQPLAFTIQLEQTESPPATATGPDGPARVRQALDFLRSIDGELVDVVTTRLGTITDCLMRGFPHEITVLRKLPVTLRMQQVRIATSQAVIIPPEQPVPSEVTGFPDEQDAGAQATDDTSEDPAQEARDVSIARELAESAGLL